VRSGGATLRSRVHSSRSNSARSSARSSLFSRGRRRFTIANGSWLLRRAFGFAFCCAARQSSANAFLPTLLPTLQILLEPPLERPRPRLDPHRIALGSKPGRIPIVPPIGSLQSRLNEPQQLARSHDPVLADQRASNGQLVLAAAALPGHPTPVVSVDYLFSHPSRTIFCAGGLRAYSSKCVQARSIAPLLLSGCCPADKVLFGLPESHRGPCQLVNIGQGQATGLTARVMRRQCGDLRRFASSAERPGSGSPRTAMFGVNSAVHIASRSAKTSAGAARNSAIVCPSSVASTLHC
jgi:hypothetical protein